MVPTQRLLVPTALSIGVVCISTAALFVKLALHEAAPSVIAAARLGIATVLLASIAAALRRSRPIRIPRTCRRPILLAGGCLGVHFFFWTASLRDTSVLSSVVIVTTNPLFVGLASFFLLKEPLRRGLVVGILFAAAGGLLIALTDASSAPSTLCGNLFALVGAIMMSCYLLAGRCARRELDVVSYILPVYGIAALLLLAAALFSGDRIFAYKPTTYLYLVLLAVVPQLIGHSCLNWALAHVTATTIAVCILGEPIGAGVIAYFALNETISRPQAIGAALILAGIFLSTRGPKGAMQEGVPIV